MKRGLCIGSCAQRDGGADLTSTGPRVIVVTLSEPYPFGHVSGRSYYALLKELSRRQYQVRCLSVSTNKQWAALALEAVKPLGVHFSVHPVVSEHKWLGRKWRTLHRPFSYTLSNSLKAELAKEIRRGYDVLQCEQLWAGYLAEAHPRALVTVHHLTSLDQRGLNISWRPRPLMERYFLASSEARLLRRLTTVGALSRRLAESIRSINRKARVFVVPFALEPSLYHFVAEDRSPRATVGFIANMRWTPGYLAAIRLITRVFPLIKRHVPHANLLLAGWQAREALSEFVHLPDVTILEDVPDAGTVFEQLKVLAYPLPQGTGVKVKVLEAMAWGIPVVTTTDGVEGIEVVDAEHCFVSDDDGCFAERVAGLLQDADLRRSIRLRARTLIEERHSPAVLVDRLEEIYRVV